MSDTDTARADALADMPIWKVLLYVGLQAAGFTGFGLAMWNLSGRTAGDFVTVTGTELGAGLLLALALIATSALLARAFPKYVEWLVRSQARNYPFLKHRISLAAIIFISICAGVGEEVFFRGGLQTVLGDYVPLPFAIALASALFAIVHFAQPLNSALIFVIGCLFGLVYWATGSLLTVILGHMVYDIYALWALQNAMHEFGVFDEPPSAPLLDEAERETLAQTPDTSGETL